MKRLLAPIAIFVALSALLPSQIDLANREPAPSTPAGVHEQAAQGAAQHPTGGEHAEEKSLAETPNTAFFVRNFVHLIPHPVFGGHGPDGETAATFYNNNLFQVIAVILILIIFSMVRGSFGSGPTGGFTRVFRGWCHWLRDEVVYSIMGAEQGRRWAPFFLFLFFFLAFMNLLGLVPVVGVTATASYYVTGTLAGVTFLCMIGFGCKEQGVVGFFKNLLPHGLPVALIPLMAPIELVGLIVKPFALMVRLFANMLGGHMVVYAFLGMIFLSAKMMDGNLFLTGLTAIPAVGMSVFIMIIEGFISLLQVYVFTYLSVIFVQQAMHPAH